MHSHSKVYLLTAALMLTACGGGTDGAPAPATPTGPIVLSGTVVVNTAVSNATVCLDVNANAACDSAEPSAPPTGADGAWSITVDANQLSAADINATPLIAQIPGDHPTAEGTPYTLRQVSAKSGQINPLTTFVAEGMRAHGYTEAAARSAVAQQLGIDEAKIDDYQSDLPPESGGPLDTAKFAARFVANLLAEGLALEVANPTAAEAAQPSDLRSLSYTDAGNYAYTEFQRQSRAAGETVAKLTDVRVIKTNGLLAPETSTHTQAYLGVNGWTRCTAAVPIQTRLGNPSRATYCQAEDSLSYRGTTAIAGQSMATVVNQLATTSANGITPSAALTNALGGATFPAGSNHRWSAGYVVNRPFYINNVNTDFRPQTEASTLSQLVLAKPAASVNLANGGGMLSLGVSSSNTRNLRVAFTSNSPTATTGSVQYYECDLSANQTTVSNCSVSTTGIYVIDTVHGVKVMRFLHTPATPAMNHQRGYAEVSADTANTGVVPAGSGNWVFVVRQRKEDQASVEVNTDRLDGTAWGAMKSHLGL